MIRIGTPGIVRGIVMLAILLTIITPDDPRSTAAAGKPNPYVIDVAKSEITVILTQEGLLGRLRPTNTVSVKKFSGQVVLPPGNESAGSVTLDAESGSLENADKNMSDIEKREFQNILHKIVLETEKYPSIKFQSVSITNLSKTGDVRNFTLNGKLTLRGVTRNVSLPVKVTLANGQLRATGEGGFKQTLFGITPYSGGLGTIKVGDEVKVSFNVVAKTL